MSFQVMFMVRELCEEYGKIFLNFRDGQKKFGAEDLESITSWCKNWDEDTFSKEFKPVQHGHQHPKCRAPASANIAGFETGKDPPGIYTTPWEHLSAL